MKAFFQPTEFRIHAGNIGILETLYRTHARAIRFFTHSGVTPIKRAGDLEGTTNRCYRLPASLAIRLAKAHDVVACIGYK